jgi:hypothetical protein
MKILFEVLECDRYEIVDPVLPAGAEARKIAHHAGLFDTVRILEFDPDRLQIVDVTSRFYDDYQGSYLEDVPLWIRERLDFEALAAEERRERREMLAHIRSVSQAA